MTTLTQRDTLLDHLTPQSRTEFYRFGWGAHLPLAATRLEEVVFEQVRRSGLTTAVIDADGWSVTYAELDAYANTVAHRLVALGVRPGDRVGIFDRRGIAFIAAILGVLKAGAAWVPQDARISTPATLQHIVDSASLAVVLTSDQCVDRLGLTGAEIVSTTPLLTPTAEPPRVRGDSTAVVIYTSGTTGTPNGVLVTHANLINTLLTGPAGLGIRPGMRVGQILNIAFDMSVWEIFGALTHGATVVIRGADIAATAQAVDVLIATPSVLDSLDPHACRGVKIVAVAGERCPQALAQRWSFTQFHNACGPTEVTIVNTVHLANPGERLTIGHPIPNTTVYVLDDQLQPVETGAKGEMWAGGACVTDGYLGDEALTQERYRPDPFNGGLMFRCRDLVSWTPEGRLHHHGRTDNQVKIRGFRVELDAITQVMERVVSAAATVVWDGRLVGVLTAPGTTHMQHGDEADPLIAATRATLTDALAYYHHPELFVLTPALPMTNRGKVDSAAILHYLNGDRRAA